MYLPILDAQPKYIDADMAFIELFRYQARPPKWVRSPQWVIQKTGPYSFWDSLRLRMVHCSGTMALSIVCMKE